MILVINSSITDENKNFCSLLTKMSNNLNNENPKSILNTGCLSKIDWSQYIAFSVVAA